jgi:hypothetical protein
MASPIVHPQLPLLVAGLPDRVAEWLRQAGVPIRPWLPEAAGGFWQRVGRGRREFPDGRFVLYDSRREGAAPDVRVCRRHGLVRLDAARLICRVPSGCAAGPFVNPSLSGVAHGGDAGPADNPSRSTFLDRLKSVIEKNGGLWARVADFPFPYRCALTTDGPLAGAELLPTFVGKKAFDSQLAERVGRRYRAGLPMAVPAATGHDLGAFPLLWRTTRGEFRRWWQERLRVGVRIEEAGSHYRIDCRDLPAGRQVVIELWRGGHVASLPITGPTTNLSREGLVFQREPQRHPGGFTSWWPDGTDIDAAPADPAARRSARGDQPDDLDATLSIPA